MRATLLASSPAPSARARPLTRPKKPRGEGRTASSREPFLLVRLKDDVTKLQFQGVDYPAGECRIEPRRRGTPPCLRANWMRRGLASPGRDAGRMAACRRHLPGACNTSSPPPGLTEPSGACRHRVAADRPRRAGRAILSFSIGGAGGVQSGMGCAGGAGKKLLAAMPPQWRI